MESCSVSSDSSQWFEPSIHLKQQFHFGESTSWLIAWKWIPIMSPGCSQGISGSPFSCCLSKHSCIFGVTVRVIVMSVIYAMQDKYLCHNEALLLYFRISYLFHWAFIHLEFIYCFFKMHYTFLFPSALNLDIMEHRQTPGQQLGCLFTEW